MNMAMPLMADVDNYLPRAPILTATETARILGYSSTASLAKARQMGRLPIEMFRLPGRRGWFASTSVVRTWLQTVTLSHADNKISKKEDNS
jgi:hypothetical protein